MRKMADGGHTFVKKTFGKPTYCHHCSDLIWGIIQIGYICEGMYQYLLCMYVYTYTYVHVYIIHNYILKVKKNTFAWRISASRYNNEILVVCTMLIFSINVAIGVV